MQKLANFILSILLLIALVIIIKERLENKKLRSQNFSLGAKLDSLNVVVGTFKPRELEKVIEREKKIYITKRETLQITNVVPVEVLPQKIYYGIREWNLFKWIYFIDTLYFNFKEFRVKSIYYFDYPLTITINETIEPSKFVATEEAFIAPGVLAKNSKLWINRHWKVKPSVYVNAGFMGNSLGLGITANYRKWNFDFAISEKAMWWSIGYKIY